MVLMCGCSNQAKEEPVEASVDQEATSKLTQEKQLVERQLYEKLSEAVETLGYTYDMQTFAENEYNRGVLYSELVDFDNDGVHEVYAFMKEQTTQYLHIHIEIRIIISKKFGRKCER